MTRRRVPEPLVVVAWNAYVANHDAAVHDWLTEQAAQYAPHVIAVSEARTHVSALHLPGYTRLQEKPAKQTGGVVDDTGDTALLVRSDVLRGHRLYRMRQRWMVMSHRRVHTPRQYQAAVLRVDGHRWRIRGDHWPTLGFDGPNRRAFAESARRARRWLRRGRLSSSVIVGDLNEQIGKLADWFGPRFRLFGKHIDVAVTRGVAGCEWEELSRGGSDHAGRVYRFTASS